MKIAVFGATGTTGVIFVEQALKENYQLKLYCRPQSIVKLGELSSHASVEIIQGGFDDDFTPAVRGVAVVVSFLGPGLNWPSGNPLEKVMMKIMQTMRNEGVTRFVTMGTPTIADPLDKNVFKYRILVSSLKLLQPNVYNDMVATGNLFKSGNYDDLDWTVARICFLKSSAQPKEHIHVGYVGDGQGSLVSQRVHWVKFILTEILENHWIRKMPFITSI
ncbi:unnamed protein product [Adineta ricciae]|uniref:NAD(P)-binding domain-containing protein n=1 Tax=Adineta ricciae TaxID=249248 RepID=A0A815TU42_ADIRI|nr:unnamed protein product [Adineta ricciae]CAF1508598.1 unnamed protein product [Adineta ricciae]